MQLLDEIDINKLNYRTIYQLDTPLTVECFCCDQKVEVVSVERTDKQSLCGYAENGEVNALLSRRAGKQVLFPQ